MGKEGKSSTYREKLLDPRWQKKRLHVLERDGWTCQQCGDRDSTLHVHHRMYFFGMDPWDYRDDLLVTLCKDCHEEESYWFSENKDSLAICLHAQGYMSGDFLSLLVAFGCMHSSMGRFPPEVVSSMIEFALTDETMASLIADGYWEHIHRKNQERQRSCTS